MPAERLPLPRHAECPQRRGGGPGAGSATARGGGSALRRRMGQELRPDRRAGQGRAGARRGEARRGLRAATETETGEARARLPASASGAPGGRGRSTARARVLRRERRRGRAPQRPGAVGAPSAGLAGPALGTAGRPGPEPGADSHSQVVGPTYRDEAACAPPGGPAGPGRGSRSPAETGLNIKKRA